MAAKRQHFIPILHLKHFVDARGQVWTYDAEIGGARSATPDNTAVQTHFYSAAGDDGTMDTRIEDHLAKMESNAAPVYETLLQYKIPRATQARADFATFLALMYARTPAMRRMNAEVYGRELQIRSYAYASNDKAFQRLVKGYEKERGQSLDAETQTRLRKDMLDPSGYMLEIPQERTLKALSVADELAPILFKMKWSLAVAEHGYFITSDHPLMRLVDRRTSHPIYGDHGFYNRTAEVSFPLSPRILLLMSWNESAREIGRLDRGPVTEINRARAANSDRCLYAHLRDKRLERLAAEFKDSRPRMTTRGFGPKKFAAITVRRSSSGERK